LKDDYANSRISLGVSQSFRVRREISAIRAIRVFGFQISGAWENAAKVELVR
jgi:hypothetical protein